MSFEGYYQLICTNGHYFERDIYEDDTQENADSHSCGSVIAWRNLVDQTNCEDVGIVPQFELDKLRIKDEVIEVCEHCGSSKITSPKLYRAPSDEETKQIQYYMTYRKDDEPANSYDPDMTFKRIADIGK